MSDPDGQVRELLEGAAGSGRERDLLPGDTWSRGRRRRAGKRAGAGAAGILTVAAVGGLIWQVGFHGGTPDSGVASLPTQTQTFVLAGPDAPADPPDDLSGLRVPTAEELAATRWTLRDELWGSGVTARDTVGSTAHTTFSFAGEESRGWGFSTDECGGGWFQEELTLGADGTFPPGGLATDDQGCPEPAQTSEDFWIDVLSHGGSLHLLQDDWLLLSVDTSWAGVEEPPDVLDDSAARLDFLRVGADPATVDTSLPERAPTNEDLAGTEWTLLEWVDGGSVLADLMEDPSLLGLTWQEGWPSWLALDYDGCDLVTVQTEGVGARGGAVPPEDRQLVTEAATSCAGAEEAPPLLADAFGEGAQVTLVGDDLLILRLTLPPAPTP